MLMLANIERHRGLSFSEEVKNICRPLLELNDIHYFHYFKIYPDHTCISITTHPEWVKTRFQLFQKGSLTELQDANCQNYQLWDLINPARTEVFTHASKYFDISHGITITKKQPDNSYKFYHFATHASNLNINHFYLNNINILEHFIHYFNEKAQSIIKNAELNKMHHDCVKSYYINDAITKQLQDEFLKKTSINKYYLSLPQGEIAVTAHELAIIKHFADGLSAKEIARIMSSSYRTVETQIANLKIKLSIKKKTDFRGII